MTFCIHQSWNGFEWNLHPGRTEALLMRSWTKVQQKAAGRGCLACWAFSGWLGAETQFSLVLSSALFKVPGRFTCWHLGIWRNVITETVTITITNTNTTTITYHCYMYSDSYHFYYDYCDSLLLLLLPPLLSLSLLFLFLVFTNMSMNNP